MALKQLGLNVPSSKNTSIYNVEVKDLPSAYNYSPESCICKDLGMFKTITNQVIYQSRKENTTLLIQMTFVCLFLSLEFVSGHSRIFQVRTCFTGWLALSSNINCISSSRPSGSCNFIITWLSKRDGTKNPSNPAAPHHIRFDICVFSGQKNVYQVKYEFKSEFKIIYLSPNIFNILVGKKVWNGTTIITQTPKFNRYIWISTCIILWCWGCFFNKRPNSFSLFGSP